MSIFDFLLGTPKQQTYEPEITGARNELLSRILENLDRGPISMPTYFAPTPSARFAGANNLLASLGLDQVNTSFSLPLTDVGGVQAYNTQALADQMLEAYKTTYPEEYAAAMNRQRMNTMAQNAPVSSVSNNNDDDYDPIARHYKLFPMENPANFQNSLTTGVPSAASQSVFQTADLYGNHGGSHLSKIKSDVGKAISGGGIIGAIGSLFSGGNDDDDDPSIGNVP